LINIDAQAVFMRLQSVKRGERSSLIKQIADEFGVSPHTVYRALERVRPKRQRKGEKKINQVTIDQIARIKAKKEKNRELCTEDAIAIARDRGLINEDVSVATVNARLRELGWNKKRVVQRMEATHANQVHYADFSRSEYVGIVGYDSAAKDWRLVFDGKSLRYKNKEGNQRLWLGSLVDKYSRCRVVRYYVSDGETAKMGLDLLEYAWNRPADEHPLNSLPQYLKLDNGPLQKLKETELALNAVNVELQPTTPGNKDAMGAVERQWRTFWQRFELNELKRRGNHFEIYLSQLNELAHEYAIAETQKRHPVYRNLTRAQIYKRSLVAYPPTRYEGNLLNYATRPLERRVNQDRSVWVDNIAHKAPARYAGEKILVYRNLSGSMVGQASDGSLFVVADHNKRNVFGEYRSEPDTYRETIEKQTGPTLEIKPKTKNIKPDSIHELEVAEILTLTYKQAREEIALRLNVKYTDVATFFDEYIDAGTTKSRLDKIISAFQRAQATA
jgi:transposase